MKIYFSPQYGKLYEKHEEAKAVTFTFENQFGKMRHVFLKRAIPRKINNEQYYDVFSPYGFGGPIVLETSDLDQLIASYQIAFKLYCRKTNIVSEFIRFHPLENNEVRKRYNGEVEYVGPQVIRNLKAPETENMSKSMLKKYRGNVRKGMTLVFDETGEHLDSFLDIYYSTMERNDATDYYYFEPEFFETLQTELKGHFVYTHLFYEGEMISTGLILFGDSYGYGFLGGTKEDYYHLSPNINIEFESIKWLKERGVAYYLMGGGHDGEDGIYQFKKKFAKNSNHHYFVGKNIYNDVIYDELIRQEFQMAPDQVSTSFFPAYRAEEKHLEKNVVLEKNTALKE